MDVHLFLPLTALAVACWYIAACAFAPYARCSRCEATGTTRTRIRGHARPCTGCRGTGRRLRIGRRLFTRTTRTLDTGQTSRPS